MTFDDWFEAYERDGGELMLYNALIQINLTVMSAYNTGCMWRRINDRDWS